MGDFAVAYILIGVIGLILLFVFLKMHEHLKNIDDKMDTVIQYLEESSKRQDKKR